MPIKKKDKITESKEAEVKETESKEAEGEEAKDKGNLYDRMFKENGEFMFEPLLEMELGMKIKEYQPLQEKLPKTLEREIDFLYKIITEVGKEMLLHIEFQSTNNSEMIYRMAEYHALIYRKYRMAIEHIVMFLGASKQKMISELPEEAIFKGFKLICFNEIDPEKLLSIEKPEVAILALLGKYKKEQSEDILGLILDKLQQLPKYQEAPGRYINQLLMLSKLRNLDKTITKNIKAMPIFTDAMIKDHVLYKEGKEDGIEQGIEQGREKEREVLKAAAEKKEQVLKAAAEKKEQALKAAAEKKEQALKAAAEKKEQALKSAAKKKEVQAIINLHIDGVDIKIISKALNISQKRVKQVIEDWKKQSPKT